MWLEIISTSQAVTWRESRSEIQIGQILFISLLHQPAMMKKRAAIFIVMFSVALCCVYVLTQSGISRTVGSGIDNVADTNDYTDPAKPEETIASKPVEQTKIIELKNISLISDEYPDPAELEETIASVKEILKKLEDKRPHMRILSKIAHITMTHSSYSDIWPLTLRQLERHALHPDVKFYLFSDKAMPDSPSWLTTMLFPSDMPYTKRFAYLLPKIPEPYVLLTQEDMFPYEDICWSGIAKLFEIALEKDFAYLMFGGPYTLDQMTHPVIDAEHDLYEFPYFYIQPRVWVKDRLTKYFNERPNLQEQRSPADLEVDVGDAGREMHGLAHWNRNQVQHVHSGAWQDELYPYVITGIIAGKWNAEEYPFLRDWLTEVGIDIDKRKVIKCGEFIVTCNFIKCDTFCGKAGTSSYLSAMTGMYMKSGKSQKFTNKL